MSDKSAALAELRFLLADQHAREDSAAVAARLRLLDRWLSSNRDLANNSESMTEFFRINAKNAKLSLVPLVWVSLQPELSSILTAAHYYPDTLRKYQEGEILQSGCLFDNIVSSIEQNKDNKKLTTYLVPKALESFFKDVKQSSETPDIMSLFDATPQEVDFAKLILNHFEPELHAFFNQLVINNHIHDREKKLPQITKMLTMIEKIAPTSKSHAHASNLFISFCKKFTEGESQVQDLQMFTKCLNLATPLLYFEASQKENMSYISSNTRLYWKESFLSWASYIAEGVYKNPYLSAADKKHLVPESDIFRKASKNNELDVTQATRNSLALSRYPYHLDPDGAQKVAFAATCLQKNIFELLITRVEGVQKSSVAILAAIKQNKLLDQCFRLDNLKGILWTRHQYNLVSLLCPDDPKKTAHIKEGLLDKKIQDVINNLPKRLRATVTWIFASAYPDIPLTPHHKTDTIFPLQAPAKSRYGKIGEVEQLFNAEKTKTSIIKKLQKSKAVLGKDDEAPSVLRARKM